MTYTKTPWADRVVQNPLTYTLSNNPDGTVTLIPAEGNIVTAGTAITAAVMNNLETQYDQASTDLTVVKSLAQMTKITSDTGGTKLTITDTTKDFLAEIVNLGVGLHSFYAAASTINLPAGSSSIRGLAHVTGTGFIWIYATDSSDRNYTNYSNNGTWTGWQQLETTTGGTFAKLYGLGTAAKDISNTDLNALDLTGFYQGSNLTNSPNIANFYFIVGMKWNSTTHYQIAYRNSLSNFGEMSVRIQNGGTWSAWKQLATTDQEAWTNLTLVNSWVSYGTPYPTTPGYRKNNFGEVELKGVIKSGVTTSGTVIATLPANYRPLADKAYAVVCNNGTGDIIGHINVKSTGDVVFLAGANTWLSLDSIPPIPTT